MSLAPLKLVFLTWIATKGSVLTLRMRRGVYCFRYFDLVAFCIELITLKGQCLSLISWVTSFGVVKLLDLVGMWCSF